MAKVTIVLTDMEPVNGRSFVRVQLDSQPAPAPDSDPSTWTLAQFMARFGVSVIVDALEKHFEGQQLDLNQLVPKGKPS